MLRKVGVKIAALVTVLRDEGKFGMLMWKVRYDFGKTVQEGFFVARTLSVVLNSAWSSDLQAIVQRKSISSCCLP